jgi:hypothetical protein
VLSRTFWAGLLCVLGSLSMRFATAEDWLPVSPDELHMTSEPAAPGASAVYLYRQVRPDGSVVNFDGTIYEKPIVKTGQVRYLARTSAKHPQG